MGKTLLNLIGVLFLMNLTTLPVQGQAPPAVKPPLIEAKSCLRIGNIKGSAPVTCEGEGGHNYGKAGTTFKKGDTIYILLRFRNLSIGKHKLVTAVNRTLHNKTQGSTEWQQTFVFASTQRSWAYWFSPKTKSQGLWTLFLHIDNKDVGYVQYCFDCALE